MKAFKIFMIRAFGLMLLVVTFTKCTKDDITPSDKETFIDNKMVLLWNAKTLEVLSVPMRQPDRTRYFAMIEIAVHDALNNIRPKYATYALNEKTDSANADAAVAGATYWTIKGLNLQGTFPLDTWYDSCLALIPNGISKELGKTLGQHAADAILAKRANDGFSQVIPASKIPPDGTTPGAYRQTNLIGVRPIPNWGTVVQPFVLVDNTKFRPLPPFENSISSVYYSFEYNDVKAKGGRTGSTRTPQEDKLAKFWAESRPSVIWNDLAVKSLIGKNLDAWETARLFALMHTAMADGLNTVMESKYHFYFWRPETAIHEGDNDGNDSTTADVSWIPFVAEFQTDNPMTTFISPPVPEYPSSYAMFGGAATEILIKVLGSDIISVDLTSNSLPGTTIHYNSLKQAAEDNSLSKIYAGWYFHSSVIAGEYMGREIAKYVHGNAFRKK